MELKAEENIWTDENYTQEEALYFTFLRLSWDGYVAHIPKVL
jgi:hypothetical protein